MAVNRNVLALDGASDPSNRIVLDMNSSENPVHGP
jgi:hypothetical protein